MSHGTQRLAWRLTQTLLASAFMLACASATVGQCFDYPDRRRKEPDPLQQKRTSQDGDLCDPQLLQVPGMIYQPCHRCEETLPLTQIKEDREFLEFLSESLANAGAHANQLDLQAVSQWAGEVRKRVRRLKDNLALPDAQGASTSMSTEAPIPSNRSELARAVRVLATLTSETLRNPVLRGHMLDQALSAKAVRDLEQIENLASLIQNRCRVLSRTSR